MTFISLIFLPFALLFFLIFPFFRQWHNIRYGFLILASLVFYGWLDWRYVPVLFACGIINFGAGLGMDIFPQKRRMFFWLGIVGTLGLLVAFKYVPFIVSSFGSVLGPLGVRLPSVNNLPPLFKTYPIGLSFYTLQALSYTIDVYYRRMPPTRNFLHFFAFASLFPLLLAGPIARARTLMPQMTKSEQVTDSVRWDAFKLIVQGLFLKMVIADNLAPFVDSIFGDTTVTSTWMYWLAALEYAFQLYCDFRGYSSIALGLIRLMGWNLPENFNHPYWATSVRDFWARWHISLTSWFRDYIFFPLSRKGRGRAWLVVSLWITMLLSGLWHGAGWTFVIWGGLHALFQTVDYVVDYSRKLSRWLVGQWLVTLFVFIQILVAWVFFRAPTVDRGVQILQTMFSIPHESFPHIIFDVRVFLALAVLSDIHLPLARIAAIAQAIRVSRAMPLIEVMGYAFLIVLCVYLRGPGTQFIYFLF